MLKRPQIHRESELIAEWGVGDWSPMGFKSTLTSLLSPLRASQGSSMGGACASTPTGGIVHKPDPRLGFEYRQLAVSGCFGGT